MLCYMLYSMWKTYRSIHGCDVHLEVISVPQVSLYLDQNVLDAARRKARIEQISLSKYVTKTLSNDIALGWPQGYWDLFGALEDDSFTRPEDTPFDRVATQVDFL